MEFIIEHLSKSFEKKEEAVAIALEKQGRGNVDISSLSKEERKELVRIGMPELKERMKNEKKNKEAK